MLTVIYLTYTRYHGAANPVYVEISWKLCVAKIMLSVEDTLYFPLFKIKSGSGFLESTGAWVAMEDKLLSGM